MDENELKRHIKAICDGYPNSEYYDWGVILDRTPYFPFIMKFEKYGEDYALFFEYALPSFPAIQDVRQLDIIRATHAYKEARTTGSYFEYKKTSDGGYFFTVGGIPEEALLSWDTNPYSVKSVKRFQKKLLYPALRAVRQLEKLNDKSH